MLPQKRKHSQILLKSAQGCWKCKNSSPNSKKCRQIAQHNRDILFTEWCVKLKVRMIRQLWMGYLFAQYFD